MALIKDDLLRILSEALELERTAYKQYHTRAEMITSTLANIEQTHGFEKRKEVLEVNLRDEREAIAFYKLMRNKVGEYRQKLYDDLERLEESIRNVINDEQAHVDRLSSFVGQLEERVESVPHRLKNYSEEKIFD